MPRLGRLPLLSRNNLLMLPVQLNDTAPFTRLATVLSGCRVAIVTTAGVHRRGDRPFGPSEQTYRVIPSATPAAAILQSHTSLGFTTRSWVRSGISSASRRRLAPRSAGGSTTRASRSR